MLLNKIASETNSPPDDVISILTTLFESAKRVSDVAEAFVRRHQPDYFKREKRRTQTESDQLTH